MDYFLLLVVLALHLVWLMPHLMMKMGYCLDVVLALQGEKLELHPPPSFVTPVVNPLL
jgi:hypothetical protein